MVKVLIINSHFEIKVSIRIYSKTVLSQLNIVNS
jgi:hypothetical protein